MHRSITTAETPRTPHLATIIASVPREDLTCFVKLLLAGVFLTLGISAISSGFPHSTALAIGALAAGLYLGWSGFRWDHQ